MLVNLLFFNLIFVLIYIIFNENRYMYVINILSFVNEMNFNNN